MGQSANRKTATETDIGTFKVTKCLYVDIEVSTSRTCVARSWKITWQKAEVFAVPCAAHGLSASNRIHYTMIFCLREYAAPISALITLCERQYIFVQTLPKTPCRGWPSRPQARSIHAFFVKQLRKDIKRPVFKTKVILCSSPSRLPSLARTYSGLSSLAPPERSGPPHRLISTPYAMRDS